MPLLVSVFSRHRFLPLLCLSLLPSACALLEQSNVEQIRVQVDALAEVQQPASKTYLLVSGNKEIPETDLQFREFAAQIDKALYLSGYKKVSKAAQATQTISLSYGVSAPQSRVVTYQRPVDAGGISIGFGTRRSPGYIGMGGVFPPYGMMPYEQVSETITTFTRFFELNALDTAASKKAGKDIPLWKTTVTSTGSRNDLRYLFPYLVYAAQPYFASNTGKQQEVTLRTNLPDIAIYRPEPPLPSDTRPVNLPVASNETPINNAPPHANTSK